MPRKLTTDEFIKKAREVHGDRYNYSNVRYVCATSKVSIICKEHGEFSQTPDAHMRGQGCPKCGRILMIKKQSFDKNIFIAKCKKIHENKYDYSKVKYVNANIKVCIICHEHGEFWQTPGAHLQGQGCPLCGVWKQTKTRSLNTENFVEKAKEIHGNKYDYSKVEYVNNHTKVCIICPVHGEFWQIPSDHLRGEGCIHCANINRGVLKISKAKNEFVQKSNNIHGFKYDYSQVSYVNSKEKVKIICPKHGVFFQTPNAHLSGSGCPVCASGIIYYKESKKTNTFIKESKIIHGDKYDYSCTNYVNNREKVCIICKKHGIFWQNPKNHLKGCGCPKCSASHGEIKINDYLNQNNIGYQSQYPVKLQQQMFARNKLKIDFYLPKYNTFIEFNGIQHYEFTPIFHKSEDDFQKQVERDKRLKDYCKGNKIKLIVIKYNQIDKIEEILNKKLKIN